jgi:hypothetical protein
VTPTNGCFQCSSRQLMCANFRIGASGAPAVRAHDFRCSSDPLGRRAALPSVVGLRLHPEGCPQTKNPDRTPGKLRYGQASQVPEPLQHSPVPQTVAGTQVPLLHDPSTQFGVSSRESHAD